MRTAAIAFIASLAAQPIYSELAHLPLAITTDPKVCMMVGSQRLTQLFAAVQTIPTEGGPQAVEGYTKVMNDYGVVALAHSTIGNMEVAGKGELTRGQVLTSGVVVSGPEHVRWLSGVSISAPHRHSDYTGPVNIDRYDYITFDNGWSLRPDGDQLVLIGPHGERHIL